MSASKDKRIRKEQIEAGTDKRTAAQAKEKAQHRKTVITYSVVAVALVIFFAFIFIYNSAWPSQHMTAVTINDQDYTVAQLNYYYSNSYMTFYNNYAQYLNYGMFFDPNTSLADQEYADGTSWRQYFLDAAVDDMTQIQMLCDQAEADGFTLDDDQQAAYDQEIETLQTNWENLGYQNLQQYLNMNYGKGVTLELVEQELYRTHLAAAYSQSIYDGFEYSDGDLDDYYAEHADELDVIDYAYYMQSTPTEPADEAAEAEAPADEPAEDADAEAAEDTADAEEAEETTEAEETEEAGETAEPAEAPAELQELADAIDGTDQETFETELADAVDGAVPTVQSMAGSSLNAAYSEWLLDEAREAGDATVIATDTASYVVMFLGRDTNDYPDVSFRHILIQAEDTDGDGSFSEEEIKAAADEAQSVYDDWEAGDATEDSFAELANERSDDTGSNTNGGLYENVAKGAMVDPINEWLFEDGRKEGDTTVVSYEGSYTGTHVLYFAGEDDMTYAHRQADTALRSDAYSTWLEEQMEGYTSATSHLGMCGKNH